MPGDVNRPYEGAPVAVGNPLEPAVATAELRVCCGRHNGTMPCAQHPAGCCENCPDHPEHRQSTTAARPCSSCGRVRAECRTPDQPFLSCCDACRANDGDTHSAPKGEVCTGPCDHDKHERRGPTWYGWYEPTTTAARPTLAATWVPYLRDWADRVDRTRRFGGRIPLGKRFIMAATIRTVADKIERGVE